ncbi:MAG: nucleotidyl transferase AbiEii/AbiGii toxin family protein [Patescibacteria group bacterium]
MTKRSVLTPTQKQFLEFFGSNTILSNKFYLSGGTALAAFYIPYRLSEDLDFFSEEEIQIDEVIAFLRSIKKDIHYKSLDLSTSFNRNLIFLELHNKKTLKTEFTYYPFPQIENSKKKYGVKIDSVFDIAVNKLFTIYQKPRSRDFMDLYIIIKKYKFNLEDLIKKARIKFDWNIDFIQLGSQFLEAKKLKDFPHLLVPLKESEWQNFFISEAKNFKKEIILD